MIAEQTRVIIKSTAPVLAVHGETITQVFYKRMFIQHPELRDMFNMTNQKKGAQSKALANAVFMYAKHIDNLEVLGATVEMIAQKHASLAVTRDMYPIVGENLLAAIQEVLGEAATPAIMTAWTEAYQFLADILASREEVIYAEEEAQKGGYEGKEDFVVIKKVAESTLISSFYLKRANGKKLPAFQAGQYIALTVTIPGTEHLHTRNYSLSDAPNKDHWRISVKREEANPQGVVSNYLHEYIQEGSILSIGIPAGVFVLKEEEKPVVLLAGGVGITPLLSMYQQLSTQSKRSVTLVQCALNSQVQAFSKEITALKRTDMEHLVVFDQPLATDVLGKDYAYEGFLTAGVLAAIPYLKQATIYCCGPKAFMAHSLKILSLLGVEESNIHYELFGPMEELAPNA